METDTKCNGNTEEREMGIKKIAEVKHKGTVGLLSLIRSVRTELARKNNKIDYEERIACKRRSQMRNQRWEL